ncbi:MAG: type II toxin-antitoxin system HicA family toxin [Euryarchaeota archaeon]|nr:type II toxin-antitoxin system HicA family toxin [Euryarchaeota archaeon]
MNKLPVLSGKDVVKALTSLGYYVRSQKGSHIHLRHPERPALTIPNHKEIAPGTLRTIIKQSGFTVEDFRELLNK